MRTIRSLRVVGASGLTKTGTILALVLGNIGLLSTVTYAADDGIYRNCCKTSTSGDRHCCVNCCLSLLGPHECVSNSECSSS